LEGLSKIDILPPPRSIWRNSPTRARTASFFKFLYHIQCLEVTRRRGRRRKQLLDDLGDRRGYSHLKEEALDRSKWRNRFGRGCGPVVWQITDEWMNTMTHHNR
jgi:hypothetical protein